LFSKKFPEKGSYVAPPYWLTQKYFTKSSPTRHKWFTPYVTGYLFDTAGIVHCRFLLWFISVLPVKKPVRVGTGFLAVCV